MAWKRQFLAFNSFNLRSSIVFFCPCERTSSTKSGENSLLHRTLIFFRFEKIFHYHRPVIIMFIQLQNQWPHKTTLCCHITPLILKNCYFSRLGHLSHFPIWICLAQRSQYRSSVSTVRYQSREGSGGSGDTIHTTQLQRATYSYRGILLIFLGQTLGGLDLDSFLSRILVQGLTNLLWFGIMGSGFTNNRCAGLNARYSRGIPIQGSVQPTQSQRPSLGSQSLPIQQER